MNRMNCDLIRILSSKPQAAARHRQALQKNSLRDHSPGREELT